MTMPNPEMVGLMGGTRGFGSSLCLFPVSSPPSPLFPFPHSPLLFHHLITGTQVLHTCPTSFTPVPSQLSLVS